VSGASKFVRPTQPDGVDALCEIAEIDPSGYKRFAHSMRIKPDPVAVGTGPPATGEGQESPSEPAAMEAAEPASSGPADIGPEASPKEVVSALRRDPRARHPEAARRLQAVPAPSIRVEPPIMEDTEEPPRISGSYRKASHVALKRIFEQHLKGSSDAAQSRRSGQLIPFYSGGGGGVGVTTIMGTLARLLSGHGGRVLVVDGSPQSTLGFLFNGEASPGGLSSFAPEPLTEDEAEERGRVDISCRPSAPADSLRAETSEAWAWRSITQLGVEADLVFVDVWPGVTERSQVRLLAAGNPLVIITPDIRCVLGISQLRTLFSAQEQALGRSVMPSFLLNLFDPGVPFHVEILNRLRELLGSRLLPMFIPRSDEIPEATAEGMTIMEFHPECAAAEGFHSLAEWIHNQPSGEPIKRFGPAQFW
jgi:cellulose synthase operon protein YhjQ